MKHTIFKSFFLVSMVCQSAVAQTEVKTISLSQAIDMGMKNNSYLKISQAKTDIAQAKLQQVKDDNLPKAGLSVQVSRLYTIAPFNISSTLGLPVKHFDAMIGVGSVSKEIFGGFLERAKHQTNEALVNASKMDAEKDKEEILYNIKSIYYTIYKISKSQTILDQNLRLLDEKERQAKSLEKEGVMLTNDVLKIQLQKSNLELSEVDIKNAMDISLYNLAVLIGIPDGQKISIDTNFILDTKILASMDDLTKEALESRSELKASGFRIEAAKGGLRQAKSVYYPHLDVSGMYIFLNPALGHVLFPERGGYVSAINLGLALKYNIASLYGMKGRMQETRLNIVQAQNGFNLQSDLVRTGIFSGYRSYQAAVEKISVSETALKQATESFELSSSQYRNGLLTTSDLMQSQNLLLQSQLNILQAKIDVQLAYFNLEKVLGTSIK